DNLPETANALREFTRHLIQLRATQPLLRRESWRDGLEIRWFNVVAEMSADAWTARVVGVVKAALHVQVDGLERVLAAMCEPQIAI
ncbi:hypothetical protein ONQ62_26305, partial [Salmonella enterica subsp. enterica serovar Virginia]|nr:hypothetical protein [Salmonella enterica subsp. enterica serovar Virginia]